MTIDSRPQRGSVKLVFIKVNLLPFGQCHHKPMGMYGGDLLSFACKQTTTIHSHGFAMALLKWHYSNGTWSLSLVKMSSTDPRSGLKTSSPIAPCNSLLTIPGKMS